MKSKIFFLFLIIMFGFSGNLFSKIAHKKCELIIIFDNSGSMKKFDPEGLRYKAIETFIQNLGENVSVGVLSFGSKIRDIYPLSPLESDIKNEIVNAIWQLKANESHSNLKQALLYAASKFSTKKGVEKYIILISDGYPDPVTGDKDANDEYIRTTLAQSFKKSGIKVLPIGFMADINLTLFNELATKTGGKAYTYSTPSEMVKGIDNVIKNIEKNLTYCVPECDGKECGDDTCGGTCGKCKENEKCENGKCVCIPDCTNKECGSDGCGGMCGKCGDEEFCDQSYKCVPQVKGEAKSTSDYIFLIIGMVLILLSIGFFVLVILRKKKVYAYLVPFEDNPYKTIINVNKPVFSIGRDPSKNDFVINDSKVSKQHLRIIFKDKKFKIVNLSKTNRTKLLNIGKTLLPGESEEIDDGDQILLVRYAKGANYVDIGYTFKVKIADSKKGGESQETSGDKTEAIDQADVISYIKSKGMEENFQDMKTNFLEIDNDDTLTKPISDEDKTVLFDQIDQEKRKK